MPSPAPLDDRTVALVRLAAAVAVGDEPGIRQALTVATQSGTPALWVEELLLQSILMTGYPRALVAFGLWRKLGGIPVPSDDPDGDYSQVAMWERRGEETCARVYGGNYAKLRRNVRLLHPAVDRWMLVEGYGRTLSRPGLDLMRRELCTVAQTAVLGTERQLHSHLRGALHGGASIEQVEQVLTLLNPLLGREAWKDVKELWAVVRDGWTEEG